MALGAARKRKKRAKLLQMGSLTGGEKVLSFILIPSSLEDIAQSISRISILVMGKTKASDYDELCGKDPIIMEFKLIMFSFVRSFHLWGVGGQTL